MHTNTTAARVFRDREEKDVLWKCAQSLEREERVCSFISPDLCAFPSPPSLPLSSRPLLFWLAALILFFPSSSSLPSILPGSSLFLPLSTFDTKAHRDTSE